MGKAKPLQRPKAAIYCRLSDEDRNKKNPLEDSRSIQTQKAMLLEYAQRQNWDIFDIYSDDDFSGADAERPEYNRLLRDAGRGCFDIVLCKHQSRFTRDMVHVERYINEKFPQWGVRFISLLDGADTAAPGNKKSRQINGLVNEWYLEDLSENVRRAVITQKKQGKYLASCAVYGYKKDPEDKYHLLVDEPAAKVVRRIFNLCIEGCSLNKIAAVLNEEGVPSPTKYKTEIQGLPFRGTENLQKSRIFRGESLWQSSSIHRILTNEVYMGNLYQNRRRTVSYKNRSRVSLPREQWIIVENTHEPIISRAEFELAARSRAARPHIKANGSSHLFTGKLVCGSCGGSVSFNSRKGENCYYRCHRSINLGSGVCPGVTVGEKDLIQAILRELKKLFFRWFTEKDMAALAAKVKFPEEEPNEVLKENFARVRAEKEKEEQKLLQMKLRLYEDRIDGEISSAMYAQLWEQLEERQKTLTEEKKKMEKEFLLLQARQHTFEENRERRKELAQKKVCNCLRCETLTREMLDAFVDHVEVKEGGTKKEKEIKIYWNF